MGAKYTAQSVTGLLGKNENLSSPSGPMFKRVGVAAQASTCRKWSQCLLGLGTS